MNDPKMTEAEKYLRDKAVALYERFESGEITTAQIRSGVSLLNVYEKSVKINQFEREWALRMGRIKPKK